MQVSTLKEQLAQPSRALFVGEHADTDSAREVGRAVGDHVFDTDQPQVLVNGIYNMEEYFHNLRETALTALKKMLADRYRSLDFVVLDRSPGVMLADGRRFDMPAHSSPNLGEFLAALEPTGDEQDPRICLTLVQQTIRLMEVLGLRRLAVRSEITGSIVHPE